MTKVLFLLMQVLVLIPAVSFGQKGTVRSHIRIEVQPVFNGQPLQLSGAHYVDEHGDTLTIDLFRFYMTNIEFHKANSKTALKCKSCDHLVDAEETATCSFNVDVPEGSYSALSFVLGVDSIANTSGANSGDLDPVKGMYWAWNTGYIMAKIEGHSKVCKTLHNAFEFHIGGYMPPYNAARAIRLELPQPITVSKQGAAVVKIKADIAAWLKGVDLAKTNNIVMPGKEAMQMADRYAKMFSVE